ncbi:helix-turn-helix domain-containing protein [Pseudactinotalea sp. Z1748]|uniref:helix-turn-helix domain-containing protein n=1 Tax=Pseudactinotalea sp. Z1748 TaxID=3413027 RepID=UPI003C7BC090
MGASPLWVLRRHRLQDAVAALEAGEGQDLAAPAASLGFADHAHFTRAFTQVIGVPPSAYRAGEGLREYDAGASTQEIEVEFGGFIVNLPRSLQREQTKGDHADSIRASVCLRTGIDSDGIQQAIA